jgi:hypothetical protein
MHWHTLPPGKAVAPLQALIIKDLTRCVTRCKPSTNPVTTQTMAQFPGKAERRRSYKLDGRDTG